MTTTLAPRPTVVEPPAPPRAARRTHSPGIRAIAIIVGAGAMLASFAGSWIPSLWGDETVSIMSAERSLPSLFAALGHIDAVHGSYYLFLHGWIGLFGISEPSVRLPSAIAVGFAAAGTVILGNLLLSRRIGIIAGVVLALLPRVTYIGMEARSFALSMAIAVWLTILFVRLLVRRTVSRLVWLAYAMAFSLAIYLFLYLSLLAVVHGVLLLSSTRAKGAFRRWLQAVGLGMVLAAPVVVWGLAQNRQISSITPSRVTLQAVFAEPWFAGIWLPILCWALIVLGAVSIIRSGRATRNGAVLALAWLVLPLAILLIGNAAIVPMYATRYLAFCAPAAALMIAAGIAALPRNWIRAFVGALVVALVLPGYLGQRGPYAMDGGSDWRQVSAVVGAHARPGDAVVFGLAPRPSRMPRLALRAYPADYRGLRDIELVTPYAEGSGLRDVVAPLNIVAARLTTATKITPTTVWAVELLPSRRTEAPEDIVTLENLGFTLVREFPIHRDGVYELTRKAS